jgi:uncharacterized OB-fold protein
MAALTKCKDCGHEVSKTAEACPSCGARFKLRWYEVGPFVTMLFFVLMFFVLGVLL